MSIWLSVIIQIISILSWGEFFKILLEMAKDRQKEIDTPIPHIL